MKHLRSSVVLSAVIAGVVAVTVRTQVDVPAPFAAFADGCSSFDGARIAFDFDDEALDTTRAFVLSARSDGRVGAQEYNGYNNRYSWSVGNPVTEHWRGLPAPRAVSGMATYLEDLWQECRAGFSGSTWHEEMPSSEMYGFSARWSWGRLELPFEWAQDVPIWVAARPGNGGIERVVLEIGPEPLLVSVMEVDWDAQIAADLVSPLAPSEPIGRPDYFATGIPLEEYPVGSGSQPDTSAPSWSSTSVIPSCFDEPDGGLVVLEVGKEILPAVWDPAGASVRIVNVTSNQPDSGTRPGDVPGDVRFAGKRLCVRAESSDPSAARIYTITLEAKDAYGNASNASFSVMVPGGSTSCQATPYATVSDSDPKCQL